MAAVFAVIAVHIGVSVDAETAWWSMPWLILCRWAVPFFFVAAGYYAWRATSPLGTLAYIAKRLLPLLVFWTVVYAVLDEPPKDLWWVFVTGTPPAYHLWFLPSLASNLFLLAILNRFCTPAAAVLIGFLLYAGGLALGSYSTPALGFDFREIWDPRNGPLFGFVFVAIGQWLQRDGLPPLRTGLLMFATGAALQAVEVIALSAVFAVPANGHDLLAGTLLMGVGAFIVFARLDGWRPARAVGAAGYAAFGAFAIHVLVLDHLTAVVGYDPANLPSTGALALVVFVLSFTASLVLSSVPLVRRIAG